MKITVSKLRKMKQEGQRIVMLTTYDAPTARLAEACGIDLLLVGDSLGMCVLGYQNTLQVTLEESLHHCKAVRRGAQNAYLADEGLVRKCLLLFEEPGPDEPMHIIDNRRQDP